MSWFVDDGGPPWTDRRSTGTASVLLLAVASLQLPLRWLAVAAQRG